MRINGSPSCWRGILHEPRGASSAPMISTRAFPATTRPSSPTPVPRGRSSARRSIRRSAFPPSAYGAEPLDRPAIEAGREDGAAGHRPVDPAGAGVGAAAEQPGPVAGADHAVAARGAQGDREADSPAADAVDRDRSFPASATTGRASTTACEPCGRATCSSSGKLARLGRNLAHLVNTVQDLSTRGVGLRVLAGQGAQIDITTAVRPRLRPGRRCAAARDVGAVPLRNAFPGQGFT